MFAGREVTLTADGVPRELDALPGAVGEVLFPADPLEADADPKLQALIHNTSNMFRTKFIIPSLSITLPFDGLAGPKNVHSWTLLVIAKSAQGKWRVPFQHFNHAALRARPGIVHPVNGDAR